MTTKDQPIRVAVYSSGRAHIRVAAALAALSAGSFAGASVPVSDLQEKSGPWWEPHTGKKKAQWKQETYGRKLK